jgi:hypothetical protein
LAACLKKRFLEIHAASTHESKRSLNPMLETGYQILKLLNWHRFSKQMALVCITTIPGAKSPLLFGFHTLSNDFHPKSIAHDNNGANDYLIACVSGDVTYETLVDLDLF